MKARLRKFVPYLKIAALSFTLTAASHSVANNKDQHSATNDKSRNEEADIYLTEIGTIRPHSNLIASLNQPATGQKARFILRNGHWDKDEPADSELGEK